MSVRYWWVSMALAACAAPAPSEGEPAGFGPRRLASAETANGATPMLIISAAGTRALSWVADPHTGEPSELHLVLRRPDGETTRSVLRDPLGAIEPHGEAPPQLAFAADGEVVAVYTVGREIPGRRFPASALRLARTIGGGTEWAAPVTVNEGEEFGSHNFHALLAGTRGDFYVAWLSSTAGNSGVWLRRTADGDTRWQPSRPIHAEPTCPCCRTALAEGPDGALYAAWRKIFAGEVRDIVVVRSDDGGESWTEPVRPRADEWVFPGCPHAGPALRVDPDGVVHIAWWTGKTGEAGVWYARSTDRGRSFTAEPVAIGERSAPAHVQLAPVAGGAVVAWDDGLGAAPRILMRRMGAIPGPILVLSEAGAAASYPVLGVVNDSVVVAWTQMTTAAHHAAMAERPDMNDPEAVMSLPQVGQSAIWERSGPVTALAVPGGQ